MALGVRHGSAWAKPGSRNFAWHLVRDTAPGRQVTLRTRGWTAYLTQTANGAAPTIRVRRGVLSEPVAFQLRLERAVRALRPNTLAIHFGTTCQAGQTAFPAIEAPTTVPEFTHTVMTPADRLMLTLWSVAVPSITISSSASRCI